MKTCVIWDLDGTLAHAHGIWSKALLHAAQKVLPRHLWPDIDSLKAANRGRYIWDRPFENNRAFVNEAFWEEMFRRFFLTYRLLGLSPSAALRAMPYIREHILDMDNYTLYPDAKEALGNCVSKGARCLLLSNNYPEAERVLYALGIREYFSGVFISGACGYDKPRPEFFAMAMESCPQSRYIMVGDNLKADILGARAMGITSVYVHRQPSPLADYCFPDLSGIPELL